MAKAAAPYVHPRLATIAHTGPDGGPVQFHDLTDDELDQIIANQSKLAVPGGSISKEAA